MKIKITIILLLLTINLINSQESRYVSASELNVRAGAGKNFNVTTKVTENEKVTIISEQGNWSEIQTENGQKGFVSTSFLSDTETSKSADSKKSKPWYNYLTLIGFALFAFYKIFKFFSGSSSQKTTPKQIVMNWYHCGICGTTIKHNKTPANSNHSCQTRDYHKWKLIGKVGDVSYQCNRCSTVVQTKIKPSSDNRSCLGNDYHKWAKL